MFKELLKQLKIGVQLLVVLTLLTGIIYPFTVTGIAQLFFPWAANGSLLMQNGKTIGSVLIGQSFQSSRYFWSRPSATQPYPYNALNSAGSNLGPSNPQLLTLVKARTKVLNTDGLKNPILIPIDLATASGSGLDPDISPLAALYQAERIAKNRHLTHQEVHTLILNQLQTRTCMILGEPRINVLKLNLALDAYQNERTKT